MLFQHTGISMKQKSLSLERFYAVISGFMHVYFYMCTQFWISPFACVIILGFDVVHYLELLVTYRIVGFSNSTNGQFSVLSVLFLGMGLSKVHVSRIIKEQSVVNLSCDY